MYVHSNLLTCRNVFCFYRPWKSNYKMLENCLINNRFSPLRPREQVYPKWFYNVKRNYTRNCLIHVHLFFLPTSKMPSSPSKPNIIFDITTSLNQSWNVWKCFVHPFAVILISVVNNHYLMSFKNQSDKKIV